MNIEGIIKINTIRKEVIGENIKFKGYAIYRDSQETHRMMFLAICKNEDLMVAYKNGLKIFIKGILKKAKETFYIDIKSFIPISNLTENTNSNVDTGIISEFESSGFIPSEMAKNAKVGFLND